MVVADSAGLRLVTTPGDRVDRPLAEALETPAHLRLGVVEGEEALQFTAPNGAARLSDGRLVISEGGSRLRLFGPDGTFERWIGSIGEGPGEFLTVTSLSVLGGDLVGIYDARRRRALVFDTGGTLRREAPIPPHERFTQLRGARFLPDGTLLVEASDPGRDASDGSRVRERIAALLLGPDGTGPRVLDIADGQDLWYETAGPGIRLMAVVSPVFHPLVRYTAAPGGVLRWDGARFELRLLDGNGALTAVFRVDRPASPVTPEVIRGWEEGPGANVMPQLRELRERMLGSGVHGDSLPHFETVHPAPGGALWLGAYTGHVGGTPTRWWRLSPSGELEGYLDLPEGFRVLAFEDGEVLGVERDDLEVPFVVGYRIR